MYSCNDTLAGGLPHSDIHGSTPARGSPWLFAACHVLHRLLVPRHPPNALLILDIPGLPPQGQVPKAESPSCTETILRPGLRSERRTILEICVFRTQQDFLGPSHRQSLARSSAARPNKIVHNASEPSLPNLRGAWPRGQPSRSDIRLNNGTLRSNKRQPSDHTRPETHQNLIHSNKQQHGHTRPIRRREPAPGTLCPGACSHRSRTFRDTDQRTRQRHP